MRNVPRIAAITACIVVLTAAIVLARPQQETYEITVVFDQAHGLIDGGRVWAGGGVVGEVAGVRLGADGLPHVRLRIDRDYRLRRTAHADLRVHSNSGQLNRVVVLSAGSGPQLADGAVLRRTRTDQPVEVDQLLETFTPRLRDDVRHVLARLDDSSRELERAYRDGLRASAAGLRETAMLLGEVSRDGHALRNLVRDGAAVSGALARDRSAVGAATQELSGLLDAVARRQAGLRTTLQAAPAGLRESRRALREVRASVPELDRLLDAAAPAVRELRPTSRVLARALPAATPALRDLATTVAVARPGLRAAGRLLAAAAPTARSATKFLRSGLHTLDMLRVYSPEIAGFFSNFFNQTSSYDAAGHVIRVYSGPTGPSNVAVSPDEFKDGFLELPFARTPGSLVNKPWRDFRSSFLSQEPRP